MPDLTTPRSRVRSGLVAPILIATLACASPREPITTTLAPLSAYTGPVIATQTLEGGIEVSDYVRGEGPAAELDDYVEVHYVLTLVDGTEVDRSDQTELGAGGLRLVLGETSVIPGFAAGLIGVRRGTLRKLVIPPELGYGDRELDNIPANSTLIFYLEVIAVGGL